MCSPRARRSKPGKPPPTCTRWKSSTSCRCSIRCRATRPAPHSCSASPGEPWSGGWRNGPQHDGGRRQRMSWLPHPWAAPSVRSKLLAMALLPLLVVLPLLVATLLIWGDVAYDRLLITKVRSDLAVAHGYFDQVLGEVGGG